ncbi:choice-of-anchor L domain-containing protein [Tamlana sp. 2201CG12-4]|uniref:choice-of-anchor L domain-containing protein n=1 Tax=Tamlana sp. 2201CG12-4 TaxID=3112582 RepID=UPI002DBD1574|nr:choice-of-anchor L domain-containing protein [Tamlana sp. 2201CG12-4]MEC3907587.1 choice-of-anchor L domain-containing protein [Tamlana sp. 2201CG12-4]
MFSQQISIDDSVDLPSLIQDNLVDGCVDISNISSPVNGNSSGFSSYAYFERNGSNFPFERGIMLSTGGATSGGNALTTPTLSEGSNTWGSDPDLEAALGSSNSYVNATAIEFDFISISNQFQFNYLLASEEYFGINPCQFSDGFVFLIKEAGTADPYQNIAIVPGTTTPVNTNTIHDEIFGVCAAQNEQYFDGYNIGDTNYNGRTTVLSASGTIQPNVTYHIKLIIADQTDGTFDSAVFIEGDSFRVLDLGPDISTCAGSVDLNANIQNNLASYAWYRNNSLITGATSPTYTAVQDGTYKVEVSVPVNGTNCVEDDEITVILNTEEPMAPISDYELCDNPGGNIFDLTTKDSELIPNIPFSPPYDYSYHYSDAEARSNTNPITTPINNPSSPLPIFVRVQDLDSNCFAYTSFNLVVNPIPNITPPTTLDVCDGDDNPDGFAIIDLTQKNDEITGGDTSLFVTYHDNALDVTTGNNPLPSPYINSRSRTDFVYVRVVNTNTGCVNASTILNINIDISPQVSSDTQYLNACDNDLDGNAFFDLTEVVVPILNGLTGVSTTFHISYNDAVNNENPIADETNYEYTNAVQEPGSATLYLRIEDDVTGCASVAPFEIHTNLLLTGTDTGDFALCDNDENSTNALNFNLNTVENSIANDLDTVNGLPNPINVTFYESEEDRTNGIILDKSQPFSTTSPRTLYIRIDDGECVEDTEVTLLINPILLFPNTTIPYCDDDDDGITSIDLESLDETITGGNPNFTVTYFDNDADATINNTSNQLPRFYANTTPVETLYARITSNGAQSCSTVNEFKIEVLTAPTTTIPPDIIICDNYDGTADGFAIVNLNNQISNIVTSTAGLDIDFFTSFDDADNKTNEIPETERNAYNTNTQTIYVRVEDIASGTGCYAIVPFETIINTEPVFPDISNFQICEPSGVSVADFILADKDAEILDGQTGKEVYYFVDEPDALNGNLLNAIDKNNIYQNISSPQTIYVRVENITDASCYGTTSFILQVSPDPIYNAFDDYLICDDDSNDGKHEFNLDEKANEIRQGLTGDVLNISFHRTFDNADNNDNPLPTSYTNATNPQTIYIRIESSDSQCHVVEELGINIIATPDVTEVSAPLTACSPDYSGIGTFNLETADFQILDRVQSNLITNYFESLSDINQDDGLDNSNEITTPSSFISDNKTVYIKVANTLTRCFTIIPLELVVNLPPPLNTVGTIPICDNDTDTFDLTSVNNRIVDDTSLVNISYHSSPANAEDNIAPLNPIFNYTASNHVFYVRVSDINTGCHITSSFNLQINPNPIANTPPGLFYCDNNTDETDTLEFNLTENDNIILGTQAPSQYTLTYYTTVENARDVQSPLNNLYEGSDGEIIFVRIEDNDTGCYSITQFALNIKPLPKIPIEETVPLCNNEPIGINVETGFPGDTYQWSTGETTPAIIIQPSDLITGSLDLWITITRPYISGNCANTHHFKVIASEEAEIDFTSTVDFSDPNSITVEINQNRIGRYVYVLDDGAPQTSNIFENVTFGSHTVTVRDINGCMDVSKNVFVFDIPKFFTPNNDAVYDTWHLVDAAQLPGTVIYIYNRYGKLLKTLPHNSAGWDGTYNGQNMPSDDYWYLAKIVQNGNEFDIRGHFALKR